MGVEAMATCWTRPINEGWVSCRSALERLACGTTEVSLLNGNSANAELAAGERVKVVRI